MSVFVAMAVALSGCIVDVPEVGNPFRGDPELDIAPSVVTPGAETFEIQDPDRRVDFREVWEVDDYGSFIVLDWFSNEERLVVDVDISDLAEGEQEIEIVFDNDDVLYVPFEVR